MLNFEDVEDRDGEDILMTLDTDDSHSLQVFAFRGTFGHLPELKLRAPLSLFRPSIRL